MFAAIYLVTIMEKNINETSIRCAIISQKIYATIEIPAGLTPEKAPASTTKWNIEAKSRAIEQTISITDPFF